MKRTTVILAVATTIGLISSVAGAASSGPSTKPVGYAPGSVYVYSSSGDKLGTLTGDGLNTQFLTVLGHRSG
jgi:hypothetical protein